MSSDTIYKGFKKRGQAFGIALLVTLLFLVLFESLIRAQSNKIATQRQLEGLSYGNLLRSSMDRELNALLFLPNGLTSYFNAYHTELNPKKINAILSDLYIRTKHVRNIAVAIDYQITYIYPMEGNKQALGMNYQAIPEQWPQVKEAVDTGVGVLVGPLNLVQGGKGLIYRYPVYIEGAYWGIISIVINTEPFLAAAFHGVENPNFIFAIRNLENSGAPKPAFYGDNSLFNDPGALLIESKVPSGKWQWAIVRNAEGLSSNFFFMLRILSTVFSFILGTTLYILLRERSKLKLQAMYDSLTGLANRRLLNDRMAQALLQAKRFNRHLAVMYIDLDHFKELNDTHGHAFGDLFLKVVAEKLTTCIRQADTLSRIGGDEFIIVLEEITKPESAAIVTQNIMKTFLEPVLVGNTAVDVSLSIGVSIYYPISGDTIEDLMRKADLALYEVKAKGRNGFKIFDH
jgi:diguanylate cyclase (GGDEF)-like protein